MKRLLQCIVILVLGISCKAQQEITAIAAPVLSSQTNHSAYISLINTNPPYLTSQTVFLSAGVNSGSNPLSIDQETGSSSCSPSFTNWATVDANSTSLYKTNFVVQSQAEGNGGANTVVSTCVSTQAQANAVALAWTPNNNWLPGEYIKFGSNYWQIQTGCFPGGASYDNTCLGAASENTTCYTTNAGTIGASCTEGSVTWINLGTNAALQDFYCGFGHTCGGCNTANPGVVLNASNVGSYTCPGLSALLTTAELLSGIPIPWELPVRSWYNAVIAAFFTHYNGTNLVGHVRFGYPMGGELGGLGLVIWPYVTGSNHPALRAQYISMVKKFDVAIMGNSVSGSPKVLSDINSGAVAGTADPLYADQEAVLANSTGMWGIGNQDYTNLDMYDLLGTGSNNCTYPLAAGSGCTQGDWAYNFATFPSMAHELQTLSGSTPLYCTATANVTGTLAPLPPGSTNCTAGNPGILPFLISMCNIGVGSPVQKICTNTYESDTQGVSGSLPTAPASDVLLALYPSYTSTTFAQSTYATQATIYKTAFCQFLGNAACGSPCAPPTLTTPLLGFNLPAYATGQATWPTLLNTNFNCIDAQLNSWSISAGSPCATGSVTATYAFYLLPATAPAGWPALLNNNFTCIDTLLNGKLVPQVPCATVGGNVQVVTPHLGLILPQIGQQNWNTLLNQNFSCLDNMIFQLIG